MAKTFITRPGTDFQSILLNLQAYWAKQGAVILQPYDMEVGAGTFHPATTLRALGPDHHWRAAYVQPSRRPTDGRFGENPNRMQHFYQFQTIFKPSPPDSQALYLGSLGAIGLDPDAHDIRGILPDPAARFSSVCCQHLCQRCHRPHHHGIYAALPAGESRTRRHRSHRSGPVFLGARKT